MTGADFGSIANTMTFVLIGVILVGIGAGFFFLTRALRRGTRKQPLWVRGPLVILWISAYLLLVLLLGFLANQLGIGSDTVFPVVFTLVIAGTIALLLLLLYWGRAAGRTPVPRAPAPAFSPISGDISPIPYPSGLVAQSAETSSATAAAAAETSPPRLSLLRVAYDGFGLPFRRPLLFVPFVFYMVVNVTVMNLFGIEPGQLETPGSDISMDVLLRGLLIGMTMAPLFILAVETTSHMAGEAEMSRSVSLPVSLQIAVRRFPRALGFTILYALGIAGGFLLLIVPGIIWAIRWSLGTQAVMLANSRVRESFRVSSSVTRGRWWQFFFLFVIIGLAKSGLDLALRLIPPAGILASGWLEFSWITVATTLAYLRAGGPVQPH